MLPVTRLMTEQFSFHVSNLSIVQEHSGEKILSMYRYHRFRLKNVCALCKWMLMIWLSCCCLYLWKRNRDLVYVVENKCDVRSSEKYSTYPNIVTQEIISKAASQAASHTAFAFGEYIGKEARLLELCHKGDFVRYEYSSIKTGGDAWQIPTLLGYRCDMVEICEGEAIRHEQGNITNLNICPCFSPDLVGKVAIDTEVLVHSPWNELYEHLAGLGPGGHWTPPHCVPRRRVAIIIPYRDRESHLRAFLAHMHPILQRQLVEYRIFVVEQRYPYVFNKASLMNIGYLEAKVVFMMDCVLFHDVDTLMERDDNFVICGDQPVHYAAYNKRHDYKFMPGLFGSGVLLRRDLFELVNGFSNLFFGWGGEDDDLHNRLKRGSTIYRGPLEVARVTILEHARDALFNMDHYTYRKNLVHYMRRVKSWNKFDGLSSLRYQIVESRDMPLYTYLLVDVKKPVFPKRWNMIPAIIYKYVMESTKFAFSSAPKAYSISRGSCDERELMSETKHHASRVTCQYLCGYDPICVAMEYHVSSDTGVDAFCYLLKTVCQNIKTNNCTEIHTKSKHAKNIVDEE